MYRLKLNNNNLKLINKLENKSIKLNEICYCTEGIKLHSKNGNYKKNDFIYDNKKDDFKNYAEGKDIDRFIINNNKFLNYSPEKHYSSRFKELFENDKIIIKRVIGNQGIISAYDNKNLYLANTLTIVIPYYKIAEKKEFSKIKITKSKKYDMKYILGLINSTLNNYYHRVMLSDNMQIYPKVAGQLLVKNTNKQEKISKLTSKIIEAKYNLKEKKDIQIKKYIKLYTSNNSIDIKKIINRSNFKNKIYSGRARKVREFTVNINTNIVTLYSEKSSSGKYELLKFEENNKYKRKYIKYYLENLNEDKLEEINENHSGNLLKRVLKIEIPDYDKDHVVKKVVKEWEDIQQEIKKLEKEIEKTDKEIDQMVYNLYDLTDEEIEIVEENID